MRGSGRAGESRRRAAGESGGGANLGEGFVFVATLRAVERVGLFGVEDAGHEAAAEAANAEAGGLFRGEHEEFDGAARAGSRDAERAHGFEAASTPTVPYTPFMQIPSEHESGHIVVVPSSYFKADRNGVYSIRYSCGKYKLVAGPRVKTEQARTHRLNGQNSIIRASQIASVGRFAMSNMSRMSRNSTL